MDTNDKDRIVHEEHARPHVEQEVGEGVGGVGGAVAGAAIGSVVGPIGTIIGGIAGAVGGWWAGRAVADAATGYSENDETAYRDHYDASGNRLGDRSFDDVRPAYQLGHLAARNPEYTGRTFDNVEPDLRRGWEGGWGNAQGPTCEWDQVRAYASEAYGRSAGTRGDTGVRTGERLSDEANEAANLDAKRIDDAAGYRPF